MFLSNIALNHAAEMAKFNPDEVLPELSAKYISNPVYVAHGENDIHINFIYGLRIYNNLKSTQKEWHLIHGADHHTLYSIGGKPYINSILSFLHRNLK
jgi:alpha-beta hydrolase superfamily lysophospholipase